MIDRLDAALRRHEHLRPTPGQPAAGFASRGLWDWLERDVSPVVEELLGRCDFRGHARWSVERLTLGALGRERALVMAIDTGLVEEARALADLVGQPDVREALATLDRAEGRDAERPDVAAFVAGRPWRDLVSATDYFGPAAGLNLAAHETPPMGELFPYSNPALRSLGDFLGRMLFLRIEHWRAALQVVYVRCHSARRISQAGDGALWDHIDETRQGLDRDIEALRDLCLADPSFQLREACIALVQIHAAVRPGATSSWLGPADGARRNAIVFRDRVQRRDDIGLTDQVASALAEVAGLYRSETDPEDVILQACAAHDLVLVAGPGRREAYWKGTRIEADWSRHGTPWAFLVVLAERHALGLGADTIDTSDEQNFSAKDARQRLRRLLPEDLMDRIEPAGRGTHRLDLPAGSVRLLQFGSQDRLEDVTTIPRLGRKPPRTAR